MASIARGQVSTAQNPVLSAFFLDALGLVEPALIEYAIFERVTEEYPAQVYPPIDSPPPPPPPPPVIWHSPVLPTLPPPPVAAQLPVFPPPPIAAQLPVFPSEPPPALEPEPVLPPRAVVDLRDAPLGDRLSPGRYVARWAPDDRYAVGRYEIRWWWRMALTDTIEFTFSEEFEVVSHIRARGPAYALVDDFRAGGISRERISDADLHQKIVRASQLFELYTGRSFAPTYKTLRADGHGGGTLYLGEPIIAIDQVHLAGDRYYVEGDYGRNLSVLRIYNRHITGLSEPDDRENPRIEYASRSAFEGGRFVRGHQNIYVRGVFGFTDFVHDGPLAGVTPELVSHAVRLLVMRDLPRLWDVAEREDAQKRWKLTSETTRDQSYGMLGGVDAATRAAVVGGTTGDPEIDNLIILYRRGTHVGAA